MQTRPPALRTGAVVIGNKKEVVADRQDEEEEAQEGMDHSGDEGTRTPVRDAHDDTQSEEEKQEESSEEAGQAMEMAPVEQ